MDLTSLYYFQELSKDLNMTKTAQRLYISQQTLSNHIQQLEQHYGTRLFYRKPALSLTCAGEFVLSFAQVVAKEERNLEDILSDVEHQERGTLRVGASMARGAQFLLRILPDFQKKYPRVEVRFVDGLSAKLEKKIANGELDFAVVLSDRYDADLVEHEFLQEEVYLCVPEVLLQRYYAPEEVESIKERAIRGADLRDFDRLPFSLMTNRLGGRIWERFRQAGVEPWVFFTGPSTAQTLPLCAAGTAACFSTNLSLVDQLERMGDQVNIFPLMDQGEPMVQKLSLLRHRQRYLTHFAKYFMELLFDSTAELDQIPVCRVAGEGGTVENPVENLQNPLEQREKPAGKAGGLETDWG